MANNYEQCTVLPFLPKELFTEEGLESLEMCGFSWEDDSEGLYFYAEEYIDMDPEEGENFDVIFQRALRSALAKERGIDEILIEGSNTCSKMRPGEFGGFVCRITASGIQWGRTGDIVERMRKGEW